MTLRTVVLGSQLFFLLVLVLMAVFAAVSERMRGTPGGQTPGGQTPGGHEGRSPSLVFPLADGGLLTDSFGDPRPGGRRHEGVDIMAPKMTPVLAVADGTVAWIHDGKKCCAVALRHDSGWTSRYLHLNNDTAGTDDGLGQGVAPDLRVGSRVEAGRVIGWVGDSGNAEATPPHLHFELRNPDRQVVNPYSILRMAAQRSP